MLKIFFKIFNVKRSDVTNVRRINFSLLDSAYVVGNHCPTRAEIT
jgi:hypothetical protein